MSYIKCENLTYGYEGVTLTKPLNFSVEPGDYLCIVGENGSGKSTLVKTLLGLQQPMSGSITYGDELTKKEIGYLPQQTMVQKDFPASAYEIVISGCQSRCGMRPFYSKEEKALAQTNMERMGITDLKNDCYRNLSGGKQQRVLLARALCATRKLLLLDEPVAGLDPMVTVEMYKLIDTLNKNDGITVVMITHDIEAVVKHADKVLHIGKHSFFGTREEYLKSGVGQRFIAAEETLNADASKIKVRYRK